MILVTVQIDYDTSYDDYVQWFHDGAFRAANDQKKDAILYYKQHRLKPGLHAANLFKTTDYSMSSCCAVTTGWHEWYMEEQNTIGHICDDGKFYMMKQKNKMTNKQILTYADNVNNAGFNHHISIMLTPSNEAHVSQRPPDVLYGERKYFVIENVESVAWEEIIKNFNKIPSPNDHMVVVKFKGHGPGQDLNFGLDGAWPILGSCFSSSLKSNVFIKPSALGAFQARLRTSVNERYRTGVNWLFEIDSCNGANHLEKVKKGYPNEHVSGVIYSSVKTVSWFGFRKRSLSIGLMGDKEEYGWNHTRTEDNANLRYITADMSHCDRPNETLSQTTQLKWYNLSGHACDWTDYAATSGYLQKYMRLYYDYLYSHFLDSHRTWLERQDHTYYSEEWLDLPGGIE